MFAQRYRNALPKGYQLQEYCFQTVLGVGGFGITYLAQEMQLNQQVAIKEFFPNELAIRDRDHTLSPKSQKDTKHFQWGLERFLEEARTIFQLKHPNIVRIMRFFPANNTAYIVMEYEQGQSLANAFPYGYRAREAELMVILPPLLDALETVHHAGYLHRDIKPDNIYLRKKDNSPVLLDFGAARFEVSRRSLPVTSLVTPGYAPLEQYESDGSQQGAWTDIYGLGAVLYRLIEGTSPVEATTRINATIRGKADPLKSAVKIGRRQYSENLLQAIDWALKVNQEERPQNILAWRTQLFPSSPESSLTQKNIPSRRQAKWLKWYGKVAVLLVFVAVAGYGLYQYLYLATPELLPVEPKTDYLEQQRQQLEAQAQRLEVARTAAAIEAARLERDLEQLKQQRETPIQPQYIQIAQRDAIEIGQKIWMNESLGKISGLTVWNEGENFASLGIGHFIWYSQNQADRFTETFPDLLIFMQKQGVILPDWLQNIPECPWVTRQEFLNNQQSDKMLSLRTLMKNTVPLQVQFMIKRLEFALPKILETLPSQEQRTHVYEQFYRVAQTPKGVYALLDYVHFKGEGISPTERYQGQGWGLLQVLEQMSGDSVETATEEFAEVAELILKRRIHNSPPERHETRWLSGWKKRLDTYR